MRLRFTISALVAVSLMGAAFVEDGTEWTEFTSQDGRFSISFHGKPIEREQEIPTPVGNLTAKMFIGFGAHRDGTFVAAYNDYPNQVDAETRLEAVKSGIIGRLKAKIISEKKITHDTYPGREVLLDAPSIGRYRTRFYMVDLRLYQLAVGGTENFVKSEEADQFLDSFKLIQ